MSVYLIHYGGEVGLKGQNRRDFENQLIRNIKVQLHVGQVDKHWRSLLIESPTPLDFGNIFGIAWWAEATKIPATMEAIFDEAKRQANEYPDAVGTFAVRVQRSDKSFPFHSNQVEAQVGGQILEEHDWKVNLTQPDLTIQIEITPRAAFVYTKKNKGLQGLPVGSSGSLVGLFSGGMDSAVASYLMSKRGASLHLLHFYALRDAETAHQQKVGQLAKVISQFAPQTHLHYIPYHHFQMATLGLPTQYQKYDLVTFRRFISRVAEQLAGQVGAKGLFSGDSLGQVASQTLENLAAVDRALTLPLFRPLIAYDKQEIIDLGLRLGMYDLANQDYKDCCSIIARKPATRARLNIIQEMEKTIQVEQLIEQSLAEMTTFTLP